MITAVDTNILLDVLLPDPQHGEHSARLLQKALDEGNLVMSDIVYAELAAFFPQQRLLQTTLHKFGIHLKPFNEASLYRAGQLWRSYREKRRKTDGPTNKRMLADFLIGSHAQVFADRLLTRDRGFYRSHFDLLKIMV